ncbi:C40 family peptidase [Holdemania massiliensis]|uniref:C40 family peptidase n=1 Tax=Holdemania massiliensis TaxID=1468449 RepID=UPI001F05C666|nr:C40 family peptidase [Holdemania massiliensis]MCH1940045.1 C40 family peptidase [Holdemania massiliensis]
MDYTSPADLCRWAEQQLSRKTIYKLGGIGRYDSSSRRVFDCVGLIKCFLWHDYGPGNTSYYGKTAPDINADQMYSKATVKGPISTIPEIPGLLVWQPGHIGIYIGNGQVIEATAKRWGSIGGCVVKSQFINKSAAMYRGTWTHWLRCPFLMYPEEGSKMYLKPGYQSLAWQGQTIHVYKRRDDQDIGLLQLPGQVTKTIDKIDDDHIHYCKVNWPFFNNHPDTKEYGITYGRNQGFTRDDRPAQKEYHSLIITKDGRWLKGDFESWEYPKDEIKLGTMYAVCLLHEGKDETDISSACGNVKYTVTNTQTILMGNKDEVVFAVVSGKLNGVACRQFAKAYGMTECYLGDSGGSSQMIVDGAKKVYTGRPLTAALTFYKTEQPVPEPEPTPDPEPEPKPEVIETMVFECTKASTSKGYPMRKTAPSGEIAKYLKVGDRVKVVDIQNKGKNQYTSAAEPWCQTEDGLWFAFDKGYFK